MILVVEGISASGKSSWCAKHAPGQTVPENGRVDGAPDRKRQPQAAADFWAELNVRRWQAALALERKTGLAVCDTDPLKLHYMWCLWRVREVAERDWLLELAATRRTFSEGRIGFADCYIVQPIDPQVARLRARADKSRRRTQFELHVRLQEELLEWYRALDQALPGRVISGFPSQMPVLQDHDDRYDLAAFDRMIAKLRRAGSGHGDF